MGGRISGEKKRPSGEGKTPTKKKKRRLVVNFGGRKG